MCLSFTSAVKISITCSKGSTFFAASVSFSQKALIVSSDNDMYYTPEFDVLPLNDMIENSKVIIFESNSQYVDYDDCSIIEDDIREFMDNLKNKLLNVSDSYYDFVVACLTYAKKKDSRAKILTDFLVENPQTTSSEVLSFIINQDDFDEDNIYSIEDAI